MRVGMQITGANIAVRELYVAANIMLSTTSVRKVLKKAMVPVSRESKKLARRVTNKDGAIFENAKELSKAIKYQNGKSRKLAEVRLVIDQRLLPQNAMWHGRKVPSAQWQEHGTSPGIGESRPHKGRIQGKYFMYRALHTKKPEVIGLIEGGVKALFAAQNAKSTVVRFL